MKAVAAIFGMMPGIGLAVWGLTGAPVQAASRAPTLVRAEIVRSVSVGTDASAVGSAMAGPDRPVPWADARTKARYERLRPCDRDDAAMLCRYRLIEME